MTTLEKMILSGNISKNYNTWEIRYTCSIVSYWMYIEIVKQPLLDEYCSLSNCSQIWDKSQRLHLLEDISDVWYLITGVNSKMLPLKQTSPKIRCVFKMAHQEVWFLSNNHNIICNNSCFTRCVAREHDLYKNASYTIKITHIKSFWQEILLFFYIVCTLIHKDKKQRRAALSKLSASLDSICHIY